MSRADRRRLQQENSKQKESVERATLKMEVAELQKNSKKKKFATRVWSIIAGLCVLIGTIIPLYLLWQDKTTTKKEKFEAENFETGKIKPIEIDSFENEKSHFSITSIPPSFQETIEITPAPTIKGILIKTMPEALYFKIGTNAVGFKIDQLRKGVLLNKSALCPDMAFYLILRDNRIYISCEFKDFESEEFIGIIEYNHWRLYLPNLLDWDEDDNSLEVRDKKNRIVCSVNFDGKDKLQLAGYFISDTKIAICPNAPNFQNRIVPLCLYKTDSNWRQTALASIHTIKSIFPK